MKKREKHITRLHIILFFLVLIVFLSVFFGIRSKAKGNIEKYKTYENNMIKGARNYVKYKNISLEEGEETKISLSDLQKSNFVYDIPSECKGYVLVIYEENIESETLEMEYSAYLKCGKKYTSVNYSEY